MKFTLSWLKEHLDTEADVETIAEQLTALGLEVEERRGPAEGLAPFTSPMWSRPKSIPMPTSCGSAWSIPAPERSRSSAARPMRAPA